MLQYSMQWNLHGYKISPCHYMYDIRETMLNKNCWKLITLTPQGSSLTNIL